MTRVLVLAAGNEMRGDDAAGPALVSYVERLAVPGVRTVFDFQFQVEHAVDVAAADLALFIDAHVSQLRPVVFSSLDACAAPLPGTHALSPAEVLGVARQLGLAVPPVFVLSVAGSTFELGAGMSAGTRQACSQAEALLAALLASPTVGAWQAHALEAGAHDACS